ncbi:hypothetical protein [Streptomyces sp. NPDC020298]
MEADRFTAHLLSPEGLLPQPRLTDLATAFAAETATLLPPGGGER